MAAPDPEAPDDSPVIARLSGPPSAVSRPDRPWGAALGVAGLAALGLLVFSSLSQGRQAHAQAAAPPAAAPAPPPVPAPPAAPPARAMLTAQLSATEPPPDPTTSWKGPAMVVDLADDTAAAPTAPDASAAPARRATLADARESDDDRFAEKVAGASANTARATRLADTTLIVPQGAVIPAILETAISSELPGYVRALVTRDVRGFDGSTVLIPRGSRLIGQYRSGVAIGQSRAFVVWSRLLTPDGVSVDIASPGADRLGRGGLEGETNTHFFRRFGSSILLSVLSAGLQAASTNTNGANTAIIIGSQQQANSIASIALQKEINVADTITVAQGSPIRVFVSRDLDFSDVVKK